MKPKLSDEEKRNTMAKLDSIVQLVKLDSLTFEVAAGRFSEDTESKVNGGQMVNPNTASAKWKLNELATSEYTILNNLEMGEISSVHETTDSKGRTVYKVLLLRNRTSPHVANLNDDYNLFKAMALQRKQNKIVNEWIEEKLKTTYFRINERYSSCNTILKGWWGDI